MKYPEPGLVKTRLAKNIGEYQAASLYRLFVEAILARTEDARFSRIIFYSPPEKKSEIMDWLGHKTGVYYPQRGDTLGEKLSNAIEVMFKNGAGKVVTIGTDSPTVDKKIILKAFEKLENKPCVIGPAIDGGYYLIGLSSFHKKIFKDIDWSTENVLKQTRERLNELKLNFAILDEKPDIDSFDDLLALKDELPVAHKINPVGLAPIISVLLNPACHEV